MHEFGMKNNRRPKLTRLENVKGSSCENHLTIRLRARVFYEQIVNEEQLSLVENVYVTTVVKL